MGENTYVAHLKLSVPLGNLYNRVAAETKPEHFLEAS